MQHGNFVQMDNWHEVQTGSMECFDVKGEIRETFFTWRLNLYIYTARI